jgi:hypothetical protein
MSFNQMLWTRRASPPFETARVLVRFDHVACFVVNANHSIVWGTRRDAETLKRRLACVVFLRSFLRILV